MPTPSSSAAAAPRVTVVIPAFGGADLLAACLHSIAAAGDATAHEVIVVLNGPRVQWGAELEAAMPGVRVISSAVNLGFAGGCNLGVAAARGECVVLLNDDARVQPGWLDWLIRTADLRPDAGAVGGRLVEEDGSCLEAGAVVFATGHTLPVGRQAHANPLHWDFVREVDYCSAALLLVRRTAWQAAGGLDAEYHPAYCEDCDLCFRLQELGWSVLYEPRSSVVHHSGQSSEASFREFCWRRNHARFTARWRDRLAGQVALPAGSGRFTSSVESAAWRARPQWFSALVVAGEERAADAIDAARGLVASGCVVSLAVLPGMGATTDTLRDLGVRVVPDLPAHLALPGTLFDIAVLLGPAAAAAEPEVRRQQPVAGVVSLRSAPDAGWGAVLDAAREDRRRPSLAVAAG